MITTYPSFSKEEIAVTKRIVVPEFSTLITLSGILKYLFQKQLIPYRFSLYLRPILMHLIVAIVSLDMRLIICEFPFAKEEMKMALCVFFTRRTRDVTIQQRSCYNYFTQLLSLSMLFDYLFSKS